MPKRRPRKWIQRALGERPKKGVLHRMLGVPLKKKIPLAILRRAARSDRPLLARRAQFAINVRGLEKK